MFFLKIKTKKNFKPEKRYYLWRFSSLTKTFFLLLFLFSAIVSFTENSWADSEIGISVSATIEGGEEPPVTPLPSGGVTFPVYYANAVFQGTAYPNAFITILRNNAVAKTGLADASGNFSFKLTGIPTGIWEFGLWAEDEDNRKSPTLSFGISLNKNTTTTFSNIFFPPTIELNKNKVFQGEALNVFGYSEPGSEINIFIDPLAYIFKKTQTDNQGKWFYSFDSNILDEEGFYSVRAKAISSQGSISQFSNESKFYLETFLCSGADFNRDGMVNIIDFSILLYWWERSNSCADQNKDGIVNLTDFSIMMYYWTG